MIESESSSLSIFNKIGWIVKVVTIVESHGSLYTYMYIYSWNLIREIYNFILDSIL